MTRTDPPPPPDHDELFAAFDLDGPRDRVPRPWAVLTVVGAVALLSTVWMIGAESKFLAAACIIVAVVLIGVTAVRGFPRIARIELRRSGVRLVMPYSSPPARTLAWRHLRATEMPSIAQIGKLELRIITAAFVPALILKLPAVEAHTLAAAIHEARAHFAGALDPEGAAETVERPFVLAALPCLACRYDRTGLGDDAPCPECGTLSPRIMHSAAAWDARPARRLRLIAATFAVAAPIVIFILVESQVPFPKGTFACWVIVLPVVALLIAARLLDRRPIVGLPTIAVHAHSGGVTIHRIGGTPVTMAWSEFLRIRVGEYLNGPYRTITIAGLTFRAGMRHRMELPQPDIDVLAAAIHRGLATYAEWRLTTRARVATARQPTIQDPNDVDTPPSDRPDPSTP